MLRPDGGMADTPVLGTGAFGRASSSLALDITGELALGSHPVCNTGAIAALHVRFMPLPLHWKVSHAVELRRPAKPVEGHTSEFDSPTFLWFLGSRSCS